MQIKLKKGLSVLEFAFEQLVDCSITKKQMAEHKHYPPKMNDSAS
jgi:hypothetical protein